MNTLEFLHKNRDNQRIMARLRRGLVDAQQAQAWPVLARLCDVSATEKPDEPWKRHVYEVTRTVAGLFATHSLTRENSDMGELCLRLCGAEERNSLRAWMAPDGNEDAKKPEGDGPMGKRLAFLLAAERPEICGRVMRVVLYAKSRGEAVDYATLEQDLKYWPQARRRWAMSFWGAGSRFDPAKSPEAPDAADEEEQ